MFWSSIPTLSPLENSATLPTLHVPLRVWLLNPQGLDWEPSPQLCFPVAFCLQDCPLRLTLSFSLSEWSQCDVAQCLHLLTPYLSSSFLVLHMVLPLRSKLSVSFTKNLFPTVIVPTPHPHNQPLKLQLSRYNYYDPWRASRTDSAPLRTWYYWDSAQVCAHAHDAFQWELTSQNFPPEKCTDIGVRHSPFKTFSGFLWLSKSSLALLAWPLRLCTTS